MMSFTKEDVITIEYGDRIVEGRVRLVSANQMSMMLEFETIIGSYAGMMPVLMDHNGIYRDLIYKQPVTITKGRKQ